MRTAAARNRGSARRHRFVSGLCAFYLLAIGTIWAVEATVAEHVWPSTLLLYAPQPVLLLPAALLLPLAAWARSGRGAFACLGACVIVAWPLMGFRWNAPAAPADGTLRVMTVNAHGGAEGLALLTETIRAQKPDVVCLQEALGPDGKQGPAALLPRDLKGYKFVRRGSLMIGARLPLSRPRWWRLEPPGVTRDALAVDVAPDGRRATVVNVHFATAIEGGSLAGNVRRIGAYVRGMAQVRLRQTESLMKALGASGPPCVVCGDFNTPPRGLVYERLCRSMRDSFGERGRGWGFTYRRDLPLWRIDYVWCGRGAEPLSAAAVRAAGSDHLPVVAEVAIPKTADAPATPAAPKSKAGAPGAGRGPAGRRAPTRR